MKIAILCVAFVLALSACGNSSSSSISRVHEKQRTHSNMKISHLDLAKHTLALRLNYRTYVEKTLHNMTCDIDFNKVASLSLKQDYDLKLDAFSTEILKFKEIKVQKLANIIDNKFIAYTLDCQLNYDKGGEHILYESVLHLVPASISQYR
ncbi:MAG: hypothetical protein L3J53_05805 [Proteobacteria bacterium]|nr:hypothetical protein [Pseudomonadota bacterium]